ncbi:autotransporter domain-containing protein [Proteus mirabilis]|uniref:autotransporter domain-containing protein n=1 Tax=Proteus mirabilis TaxID=584 RepID=UPI0023493233|nr:autotransporter domain-containing protein [Proteus mirabilis]MDC5927644.1 autotransporter domain-containing protein [Proteus mirabilis]
MSLRVLPKVFSSKYKNIIIISEENNSKISYNSGKDFHQFNIEGIRYETILSLSNNGRYAIGSGYQNGKDVFFIYDTYLKTSEIRTPIGQDYYFTTQEGRYSLHSRDKEKKPSDETQFNKKEFIIYDNVKKITIPLNDIDNSELKNHKEKERFLIYSDLTLPQNTILKSPKILGSTLDNQYFYGLSIRKSKDINKQHIDLRGIKVAFIYDHQNKKINFISNSEYGSSRINAISQNNIAVGWFEERKKSDSDERLYRRAYHYDIKNNTLSTLNKISHWPYYNNSEATDISADGELIVGWVSDELNSNSNANYATKRQAFVYQLNNKNAIALPSLQSLQSLQNDQRSSETHSISQDGHTIFGISESENHQWHTVAWYLDKKTNKVGQEKENIDIIFDTILAKKDIDSAQKYFDKAQTTHREIATEYEAFLSDLNNQLQEVSLKYNEAKNKRIKLEKMINDGGTDAWDLYNHEFRAHEDDEEMYKSEIDTLENTRSSLNNSPLGQQLQVAKYQYDRINQILTHLQQDKPAAVDKPVAPKVEEAPVVTLTTIDKPRETKVEEEPVVAPTTIDKPRETKAEEIPVVTATTIDKPRETKVEEDPVVTATTIDKPRENKVEEDPVVAATTIDKPRETKVEEDPVVTATTIDKPRENKVEEDPVVAPTTIDKPRETKVEEDPVVTATTIDKPRENKVEEDPVVAPTTIDKHRETNVEEKSVAPNKEAQPTIPTDEEKQVIPTIETPNSSELIISNPISIENSYKSMQLMAENGYKLIDMQQGQLRYLASATCSVGTEKACLSGFTHYQNIDKANAIQTGISGAYRFDINQTPLVVGLAIDSDSYSSLPTGYEYQGYPLPLIGFSVDLIPSLNPTSNGNALHLSLKGAYVNRKVTIKRPILDNTEAGKGHAKISGYYIDLQGYHSYTLNNLITVTPFAGLTFNQTSRSAYSETQGAKLAAHYQELNAHSLLAKIGLGIEYTVNAKLKLDSKAGLLWHLSHHQGDFQSHIDYLGQQKINYNDNKKQLAQRPFASVGLTYQLDKQSSVNTTTNWQMTPYRHHDIHMGIGYTYRF